MHWQGEGKDGGEVEGGSGRRKGIQLKERRVGRGLVMGSDGKEVKGGEGGEIRWN